MCRSFASLGVITPSAVLCCGQDKGGLHEMDTGRRCKVRSPASSASACRCRCPSIKHSKNCALSWASRATSTTSFSRWCSWNRPWVLVFLLLMDIGLQPGQCATFPEQSLPSRPSLPSKGMGQVDEDPLARLSKVFGIKRIPSVMVHRTPPQYMTELYSQVADTSGLTKASGPYNASTVRSFPDRDTLHQEHYVYNVSHLLDGETENERMLEAEFHLFKMKPRPTRSAEPIPPHHLQLKVYQVLDLENMYSPDGLRLLDARRISTHAHGWFTFKVTKAVENWLVGSDPNHGLLVTAQSSHGQRYNGSYIRFAQRNQHHDSKQPILVVFTDDGTTKHPTFVPSDDQDFQLLREEMNAENEPEVEQSEEKEQQQPISSELEVSKGSATFSRNVDFRQGVHLLNERARAQHYPHTVPAHPLKGKKRRKRNTDPEPASDKKRKRQGARRKRMYDVGGYRYRRSCAKHKMYVDFEEIGWSGWIISPKGYDAYHCTGECPFPLGQSQKPTNHATVQSIVHALRVGTKHVGTPCCVPNKLFSISLLYFDDDENVILKQYDDMVAASCGCH